MSAKVMGSLEAATRLHTLLFHRNGSLAAFFYS
ncbi:unnamed protein product [Angiostrongylus costaricensis]|uniref:Uncharacterized protein n=1 Tax=Angiostrongylus costaricensis TaxID=334426 RepID=A0A0R3PWB2_ANGCS|nr:unnamed protein product [Angiostrongylus costaricensis]